MGDARRSTLGSLSDVLLVSLVAVLLFVLCGLAFDNAFGADGPVYSQVTPPTVGAACSPSARPPVIDPATMRAYICVSGAWQVKGIPECNAATPTSPSCSASSKPVCIWTGSSPPALWGCNSSNAWEQIGSGGGGAPTGASYWTKIAEAGLSNEQAMGTLGTGLVINTTTTGVPTILAAQTCTNQFVRSYTASGTATCNAVDLNADTAATALPLAKITDDGTAGKVLTSGGAGGDPSWTSAGAGDITSVGDRTANAAFDATVANSGSELCWWDGGTAGNENTTCIDNGASGQTADYSLSFPKVSGALCVKGDSACGTWATGTDYNQDGTLPQVSYDSGNAVLSFNAALAGTPDMKIDYDSARGTYYYLKSSLCTAGSTLYCSTGTPAKGDNFYCFDGGGALLWCDSSGSGNWTAVNAGGGGSHAILSATHTDALAGTVTRGDVIYGNATPKWARLAKGSTGQCLTSTATDVAWGSCGGSPAWATSGIDSDANGTNATLKTETVNFGYGSYKRVTMDVDEDGTANLRIKKDALLGDADGDGTADATEDQADLIIARPKVSNQSRAGYKSIAITTSDDPYDYSGWAKIESNATGSGCTVEFGQNFAPSTGCSINNATRPTGVIYSSGIVTSNFTWNGSSPLGTGGYGISGTSGGENPIWSPLGDAGGVDDTGGWRDSGSCGGRTYYYTPGFLKFCTDSTATTDYWSGVDLIGGLSSWDTMTLGLKRTAGWGAATRIVRVGAGIAAGPMIDFDSSTNKVRIDPDGSGGGADYVLCSGDSHTTGDTLIYNSGTGCWASRAETAASFTFSFTNIAGTATNVMRPAGVYGDGFTRWYTTYAITLKGMTCYVNGAKTGGTMSVTAKVAAGNTDITLGTGTAWALTTPYSDTTCTSNCNVAADGYVALDAVTSSFLPTSADLQCQIFYVMQ